jgi:bacillithiol system protein YtxJ
MNANFIEIKSNEELDRLFEKSNEKPVVLFKHSTTCPISSGVYHEISNADAEINIVIVQHARSVSNAIAEKTGIIHQSPQAIILKNGEPVYHASHYDITTQDVEKIATGTEREL